MTFVCGKYFHMKRVLTGKACSGMSQHAQLKGGHFATFGQCLQSYNVLQGLFWQVFAVIIFPIMRSDWEINGQMLQIFNLTFRGEINRQMEIFIEDFDSELKSLC